MNLLSEIGQVQHRLSYFGSDFDACNIRVNIETTREYLRKKLSPIQSIDIFGCDFDSSACSIASLNENDCDEHPMVSTCFLEICELRFGHQNSSVCVCLSHVSFVRAIFPLSVFYISFIFYLSHCRLLCTKLSW